MCLARGSNLGGEARTSEGRARRRRTQGSAESDTISGVGRIIHDPRVSCTNLTARTQAPLLQQLRQRGSEWRASLFCLIPIPIMSKSTVDSHFPRGWEMMQRTDHGIWRDGGNGRYERTIRRDNALKGRASPLQVTLYY